MLIQIVNDQDQLITTKERSQLDYTTDIYRVSALWLTNSQGQVLLALRAATKDKDPNKWGPAVAGTNDAGESYDDNIYKEAAEEIGLTGIKFTKGPKTRTTHPRHNFCQWYLVTLDRPVDSFTIQEEEVQRLDWVSLTELKQDLQANPDNYVTNLPQVLAELDL